MTPRRTTPLPPPEERRRLREAGALTVAQVAARVGVGSGTVGAWEAGRRTPRGQKGRAYAQLLGALAEKTAYQAASLQAWVTGHQTAYGTAHRAPYLHPPVPHPTPLTPAQAFDALYAFCAPALVRQTYLLTGHRELARESVERAFQLAWQRWPEVARDRDPAGWVRAAAYDCALSPWHRFRPRFRHPDPPAAYAADRALMTVLLKLPPPQRRTLVLYDGVGLDLPETAAETEATTPAAAYRLLNAREAVAACLPELSDPSTLHRRLAELASAERLRAGHPVTVRSGGERRARFWTRAAIAFTAVLIGTTTLTLRTAPTHYEPPVPPGATVQGLPPRVAPGPLSEREIRLRGKLREEVQRGPARLVPQTV